MDAPRVTFYVLPEADERGRLVYACRLVEKAYLQDHRVRVHCDSPEEAHSLDSLLWTFSDRSFVPHELANGTSPADVSVVISSGSDAGPPVDLLVNLGREVPPDYAAHARVAEVLDGDDGRRRAGRERFRFYRQQGIEPETHNLGQP